MKSVNKIILVGRLGSDPELRDAGNNKVATFSLATSRSWKNKEDKWEEETQWHNIVVWGKQAENLAGEYGPRKGDIASVTGEIRYREYENKEGAKKKITEIVAQDAGLVARFVPKPKENQPQNAENTSYICRNGAEKHEETDDLPF